MGVALLLTAGATAATASVLVVRATGPSAKSFPAGKSLADNASIVLKQNDMLVLLDAAGTRTLRGPGNFKPNMASVAAAPTVLASSTNQRRARIGAVRSVGMASQRSPSLWHLDVSKSSNFCLTSAAGLMLWRADPAKPATLMVTNAKSGASRTIEWSAGQAAQAWPSQLAINDGAAYRLNWVNAPATNVKFKTIPNMPNNVNDMASSLIQHGCEGQLDLLIASVPESNGAPSG